MNYELLIENGGKLLSPPVEGEPTWQTERKNAPGTLTFKVLDDGVLDLENLEGNPVGFRKNNEKVFFGFIFKFSGDKDQLLTLTAYDQLRYLKNKDTYVYEDKTANEVVQMVAEDFNLQTGTLENTGYKIETRTEEDTELFDIIGNALDLTVEHTKEMFILYDDFGKITLKNLNSMRSNILIESSTGENFNHSSSIDNNTYNKIKLTYEDKEKGQRDVYIEQDGGRINDWGVLQLTDTIQKGENGEVKAQSLLALYNNKTKTLAIKNAFGHLSVRAGVLIMTRLQVGGTTLNNYMLVEKCKHTFGKDSHFMDLSLRGGEFVV